MCYDSNTDVRTDPHTLVILFCGVNFVLDVLLIRIWPVNIGMRCVIYNHIIVIVVKVITD